jgi:NADPH:quinone reductase-like Zn-dependent oxidoreductase
MYAVVLHEPGGPEQLRYEQVPTPEPGPGEVQVKLKSAALNHRDVWIRLGRQLSDRLPLVLGSDGAGVVSAVGAGVERAKVSDEVVLIPTTFCGRCEWCLAGQHSLCVRFDLSRGDPSGILGGPGQGTYAQYIVVPEAYVYARPKGLSWEQSGAFPLAGLTAYRLMISRAQVGAGERVLIHGIGSGVATFALQIARASGAKVMVTSSSDDKIKRAEELGADYGVNYRDANWEQSVLEWSAGRGADLVVDTAGSATWPASVRLCRRGGRIATCGATTGADTEINLRSLFWNQLTYIGSTMGTAAEFVALIQLLEDGLVTPVVDKVFPLEETGAAHARMDEGGQFGKIVLAIPD